MGYTRDKDLSARTFPSLPGAWRRAVTRVNRYTLLETATHTNHERAMLRCWPVERDAWHFPL